ncbi:CinA family protein [Thermomicrobium sp. 4228-Ro]|uniref:CinA family protein n=1 Tax=Thermomicrobium sp. 4228-Ro TaxID=2993937 RepID=UPI0022491C61|nr:CinA family protein [Thermomicrobium sp. 4228-Ro]MCX2726709.1 CinA family protein [Thermomicrobium sp. 4228-Ro]
MPEHPLAREVYEILTQRQLTLATAESCTGGLIGHLVTTVPGSSAYYLGGVIAYSNRVKETFLGVPAEVLRTVGAVSRECAEAMARGARERFGSDYAVATTGIAGPSGGTPSKPVGLVYVACAGPHGVTVEEYRFVGTRWENIEQAAEAALRLLLKAVRE